MNDKLAFRILDLLNEGLAGYANGTPSTVCGSYPPGPPAGLTILKDLHAFVAAIILEGSIANPVELWITRTRDMMIELYTEHYGAANFLDPMPAEGCESPFAAAVKWFIAELNYVLCEGMDLLLDEIERGEKEEDGDKIS